MNEARLTPYDLIFADPAFEAEHFPAIRHEAEVRGVDPGSSERFVMLGETGALMQRLLGDDDAGDSVRQIGRLLFHAYHFAQSGRHVLRVPEPIARQLATHAAPIGRWPLRAPQTAGYLQLPRHLFWSRIQADAPAEPADGMFWYAAEDADGRVRGVELLLVLGLRADRPGLSLVDAGGTVPEPAGHWIDQPARDDAPDFSNILPGGELRGLHSLVTSGEVLKLASLCFWYAAQPGAVAVLAEPAGPAPDDPAP